MGGGVSTSAQIQRDLGKSRDEIVQMMMPIYYDGTKITRDQYRLANECWNLILNDSSPLFLSLRCSDDFPYQSCVTYFYDTFYVRLFECHPDAKALFKSGMDTQGKYLVMMLSLSLGEMARPAQFKKSLIKLADIHYHRGIKAVEYGIMGDVLFWTLRKVMGDAYYTRDMHFAWVRVYSRMLQIIVDRAVELELNETTIDVRRRISFKMFSPEQVIVVADRAEHCLECQRML